MNIPDLFVVLAGYWPHSAPDIDDPVAVAAHHDMLGDFPSDGVLEAVRRIARTGADFCPTPGAIYAEAIRPEPPERKPYVPELEPAPEDLSDVPALLAEARESLRRSSAPSGDVRGGW